jgi:acetolactate synthase-1/2/3 large subunit
MLGLRFGLHTMHGSGKLIPLDATIIQVDPDPRELGRLQRVALGVTGDIGATARALAAAAALTQQPDRVGWQKTLLAHLAARREMAGRDATEEATNGIHPFIASQIVSAFATDKIVVADGALTYHWLSETISAPPPLGFLCHGYFGTMGYGFGTAIGAQVAAGRDGARVVLITGDGSVGFSIAEFDTAVRHRLPLIVVIMNNRSWGGTLHFQQMTAGPNRVSKTLLENGDYHDVAAAFGARHFAVDTTDGLRRALTEAASCKGPVCINVRVQLDPIAPEEKAIVGLDVFS